MQKGAQLTYFREPHIIFQRAACGSRAAVWSPVIYSLPHVYSIPTCAKFELRRVFRNVSMTYVGEFVQLQGLHKQARELLFNVYQCRNTRRRKWTTLFAKRLTVLPSIRSEQPRHVVLHFETNEELWVRQRRFLRLCFCL